MALPTGWSQAEFDAYVVDLKKIADAAWFDFMRNTTREVMRLAMEETLATGWPTSPLPTGVDQSEWTTYYNNQKARADALWSETIIKRSDLGVVTDVQALLTADILWPPNSRASVTYGAGTTTSTISEAFYDLVTTAVAGEFLVLMAAAKNAGAAGISSTGIINPSPGAVWTLRSTVNRTAGVANDGTTLSIWTAGPQAVPITQAARINFNPATAAKAFAWARCRPAYGKTLSFGSVGPGVTGSGTSASSGPVACTKGQIIFGLSTMANNGIHTVDSDTTNGAWSAGKGLLANTGAQGTSVALRMQDKVVEANGNQSYDTTIAAARSYALNYVVLNHA